MFPYPARISCCKVRTQGRFQFIARAKRGGCVAEEGRPSLQVAPRRTVHLLPLVLTMVMAAGWGERPPARSPAAGVVAGGSGL